MLKHKLFHFIISFECFTGHFGILDDYDDDLATGGAKCKGYLNGMTAPKNGN